MPHFNREKSFEAIVRTAIDAIVVIDQFNKIRSFNPGAERLLGWKEEEVLHQDMSILIPEQYREGHLKGMQRYLATGIPIVLGKPFVNLPSLHKDGYEIPTTISIATWEEEGEVFFTGILRDIRERVEQEERTNLLIKELNHRVKNSLAVIQSIISQTALHSRNVQEFRDILQERIMGMSKTHDLLVETNWSHTTLQSLICTFLKSYGHHYVYAGPYVELKPSVAVSMGMAIHELATNAIKYGAWSEEYGTVMIFGEAEDNRFTMTWKEKGGPLVIEPDKKGFGLMMLEKVIASSMRGKTKLSFEPDGFRFELDAPLSENIRKIKK